MFEEGAIVGSYRVLRKLGHGGMGAVFAGEHTLLGRKAALKVLLPSLSADPDLVQRLFNEARAVTLIADPGIVQVFDFGYHTDGSAFIVMELLEGETVEKRCQRIGRFAPVEALRLIRHACTSLRSAHAKRIVHRDLKPENMFLVADPVVHGGERIKLLDFGVAKLSRNEPGEGTQSGQIIGTPVYMSPEQCRAAHAADHRSDIYSIGCVLMKMLTGRAPFGGEGMGDLIVAHICHAPPLASARVPDLPAVFDRILERCLAKSPDSRFQSMAELIGELETAERALHGSISGLPASLALQLPTLPMEAVDAPSTVATIDTALGQPTASSPRRRGRYAAIAVVGLGAAMTLAAAIAMAVRRDHPSDGPRVAAPVSATTPTIPASAPAPTPAALPLAPAVTAPAAATPAASPPAAPVPTVNDAAAAEPASAPPETRPHPRHRAEPRTTPTDSHGLPPVDRDD